MATPTPQWGDKTSHWGDAHATLGRCPRHTGVAGASLHATVGRALRHFGLGSLFGLVRQTFLSREILRIKSKVDFDLRRRKVSSAPIDKGGPRCRSQTSIEGWGPQRDRQRLKLRRGVPPDCRFNPPPVIPVMQVHSRGCRFILGGSDSLLRDNCLRQAGEKRKHGGMPRHAVFGDRFPRAPPLIPVAGLIPPP